MAEFEAVSLLKLAQDARASNELDLSIELYQRALEMLLNIYKTTEKGTTQHTRLFQLLNQNMSEAEQVKKRLSELKAATAAASSISSSSSSARRLDPRSLPDDYNYHTAAVSAARKVHPPPSVPSSSSPRSPPQVGGSSGPAATATSGNKLKVTEEKLTEYESQIMSEMLDASPGVRWTDIAGLSIAKQTLQEAVILPNLRPDLFVGLRAPPRGVLLFGPPGTGKTLLAKAVATESGFVFFSITASSVTSKWLGEGEKLMKALFSVARKKQPSVIFFDEIDAIMGSRKDGEHEASRRIKTEFMTQLDGATTTGEDRLLIMGATNLPWELDEAVLRRLVKRIYVPLPDADARKALINHLLLKQSGPKIVESDIGKIIKATDGYSASDLTALCRESAMGPIRELNTELLRTVSAEAIRGVTVKDFTSALSVIRPSVSPTSLAQYEKWSEQFAVLR